MRLIIIAFCSLWMSWLTLASANKHKVICYFGSWSGYRIGAAQFNPSDIDPNLCTHLIYAFVGITLDGEVNILDPWNDLADGGGKNGFGNFVALRNINPKAKYIVAIGGWNEGSERYSIVVGNETLRETFVENVVDFVVKYDFDGFDVDWEYPNQRNGTEADVENFVLLLKELREKFDERDLILSASVAATENSAKLSYDIPGISRYLDFINIMTYDFHGAWDPVTGHNTPLYPAARETTEYARSININAAVNYWLSQGAPAAKIVLGTASYGKSFTLADAADHLPGSPITGAGVAGPFTRESGVLAYYEICPLKSNGSWTFEFDKEQRVPYAYSGDQWVSFDNAKSIKEKVNFIKKMGLAGASLWSVDLDDFAGVCGKKYPILSTLYYSLHGSQTARLD